MTPQNLRIFQLVSSFYFTNNFTDDNMHGIIEEEEMEDEGSDEEVEVDETADRWSLKSLWALRVPKDFWMKDFCATNQRTNADSNHLFHQKSN